MSTIIRIPNHYLFTAYYDEKGNRISKLKPLCDTLIFAERQDSASYKPDAPILLKSNQDGMILGFNGTTNTSGDTLFSFRPFTRQLMGDSDKPLPVAIPPKEALSYIALSQVDQQNESWAQTFIDAMKGFHIDGPQAELIPVSVEEKHLAEPDSADKSKESKAYKKWHEKHRQKKLIGFVLPKVRGVILTLTLPEADKVIEHIDIHVPGVKTAIRTLGTTIEAAETGDFYTLILLGDDEKYPAGLYEFTIKFRRKPGTNTEWSGDVIGHERSGKPDTQSYSYTLSAMARFDFEIPGGEFSMINLDPITLEESLITQFPTQYSHLVQAALDYKDKPIISEALPNHKDEVGLASFVKRLGLTKSWAELANDIGGLSNQNATAWLIGKTLNDALSERTDPTLAHILKMTFSARGIYSKTKPGGELWEALSTAKDFYKTNNGRLVTASAKDFVTNFSDDEFDKTFAKKLKIPEPLFVAFGKGVNALEVASATVSIVENGSAYARAAIDHDQAVEYYGEVVDHYMQITGYVEKVQVELNVQFELGSHVIPPKKFANQSDHLDQIAEQLEAHQDVSLLLEGHTCWLAEQDYNYDLSKRRAHSVKMALVGRGINPHRIKVVGHGEARPIESNDTDAGRARNRRVVAVFSVPQSKGAPCREGIQSCERFRMRSVNAKIGSYDASVKVMESIGDLALALAACFPLTAPAAMAIGLLKTGDAMVSSAVSAFDRMLLDSKLADESSEEARAQQLRHESTANQLLMHSLASQDTTLSNTVVSDRHLPEIQYRIRSEAINGLLNLLVRAAATASEKGADKTIKGQLEKYRVGQYIENFLLNDQWIYPLRTSSTYTMDELWLFTVNTFNIIHTGNDNPHVQPHDISHGNGTQDPSKVVAASKPWLFMLTDAIQKSLTEYGRREVLMDITQMLNCANPWMPGDVKADFQREFPIHHFSTANVEQLANNFKITWPDLDEDLYHLTAVYHRADSQSPWSLLTDTIKDKNHPEDSMQKMGPHSQLKVVIIFNDKVKGYVPVNLQLHRVDGTHCDGPRYKSVAKPINENDFDGIPGLDGKDFKGLYACVYHPFYQFGDMTIHGIKPMMPWTWNAPFFFNKTVNEYHADGNMADMRYRFTVSIGSRQKGFDVPLASKGQIALDEDDIPTDFPVDVCPPGQSREHEACFFIESFLRSNAITDNIDPLFDNDHVQIVPLIRIGGKGQPWLAAFDAFDKDIQASGFRREGKTLFMDGFDWKQSVEFAFALSGSRIQKRAYEKKKKRFDVIPGHATIISNRPLLDLDFDTEGTDLNFDYQLFGMTKGDEFDPTSIKKTPSNATELDEIYAMVVSPPFAEEKRKALFKSESTPWGPEPVWNYVAYKKMSYIGLNRKRVDSIRPFGSGKVDEHGRPVDEYYHFTFRNVFSHFFEETDTIDIDDFEFHFPSPDNFLDQYMPWWEKSTDNSNRSPHIKQHKDIDPELEAAKRWLEDKAKEWSPINVEAIKGWKV